LAFAEVEEFEGLEVQFFGHWCSRFVGVLKRWESVVPGCAGGNGGRGNRSIAEEGDIRCGEDGAIVEDFHGGDLVVFESEADEDEKVEVGGGDVAGAAAGAAHGGGGVNFDVGVEDCDEAVQIAGAGGGGRGGRIIGRAECGVLP
jgi:hypothetical protein